MSNSLDQTKLGFLISISRGKVDPCETSLPKAAADFYGDIYKITCRIAFTTLARTITGFAKHQHHDRICRTAECFLCETIKRLQTSQREEFDKWHQTTTQQLIKTFTNQVKLGQTFTVGQAKK